MFATGITKRALKWLVLGSGILAMACGQKEVPERVSSLTQAATAPGLVAAYGFDESSGSGIVDATGVEQNAVLSGQNRVAGRYGNGLEFSDTPLNIPNSEQLQLTNGMTLSAWILPSLDSPVPSPIILKANSDWLAYCLYLGGNGQENRWPSTSISLNGIWHGLAQFQSVPTATWSHIAASYDLDTYRLYVNGELVASQELDSSIDIDGGELRIGGHTGWGEFFHGRIDEVRIYDRALSEAEIQADMASPITPGASADTTPPSVSLAPPGQTSVDGFVELSAVASDAGGPVAVSFLVDGVVLGASMAAPPYLKLWHTRSATAGDHVLQARAVDPMGNVTLSDPVTVTVPEGASIPGLIAAYGFDEPSGDALVDGTGAGHDTQLAGQTRVVGRFGGGLEFNGNVLTVADSELLDLTTGMTLSAWVLPAAGIENSTLLLVKQQWEWNAVYELRTNVDWASAPESLIRIDGEWYNVMGQDELLSLAWSHLSVTYDGELLNLYVNGLLVGSEAVAGAIDTTDDALLIGGKPEWEEYFRGRLDELRIYNRALTAEEIQTDMQQPVTPGASADVTPPEVNLTAPGNGSTVAGMVTLEAEASDAGGAVSVQFLVDGAPLGSPVAAAPYQKSWHAGSAAAGSHVIAAQATDPAGNVTLSAARTVTIAAGTSIPGLVAAYGFDEGGGTAVLDATGAGHDGVLSSHTRVGGRYGGALEFNDDPLLLAETELLQLTTGMTLSAWVLPKADTGLTSPIVMKANDWDLSYCMYVGKRANGSLTPVSGFKDLNYDWYDVWSEGPQASTTAWTHVSATYDGQTYRLYVNGVLAATREVATVFRLQEGPLRVGGHSNWGEYFRGRIDELRVYNRALSEPEIEADMTTPVTPGALPDTTPPTVSLTAPQDASAITTKNVVLVADAVDSSGFVSVKFLVDGEAISSADPESPYEQMWHAASANAGTHTLQAEATDAMGNQSLSETITVTVPAGLGLPGLVAAYAFDEGTGEMVVDATSAGHDTELTGQTRVTGRFGGALAFSGTFLSVPDSDLLDLTNGMTISAWVMPDATLTDWSTVLMKETEWDFSYLLYAGTSSGLPGVWVYTEDNWNSVAGGGLLPSQSWSHLAATYDGTSLLLYQNGDLVGSREIGFPIHPSAGPLTIGGSDVWGELFYGRIDEVRVYNRALTAAEIQAHMATPLSTGTGADTTLPIVNLVSPPNGSTLSGLVTLEAMASDDVGVEQVQFIVDEALVGEPATVAPYQTTWMASIPGNHSIRAQATDPSGNLGTSATITVTVVAGCDPATVSDGNSCTIDSCVDNLPVFVAVAAGTPCSNGDRCDGLETCDAVGQCQTGTAPTSDTTCDGIDDDCDGQTDEDYVAQSTTCGVGACIRSGTIACLSGAVTVQCTAGTPAADDTVCNAVDDDCDGQTDEDYVAQPTTCGSGSCQANGTTACVAGLVTDSCSAGVGTGADTICNGIDDDCDGTVDEDYLVTATSCGVGVCAATGSVTCEGGALVVHCTPGTGATSDLTCDGLDDDCDGQIDEDYQSQATACGVGACLATGATSCLAGVVTSTCLPGSPAPDDPTCNAVDDDCDGTIDEDYAVVATNCGVGACAATGVTSCAAGVIADSCAAHPASTSDATCNGVDDDCDGITDEDYVEVATSCGVGACGATGLRRCQSGQITDSCVSGTPASSDITCNGVDDDCNGQADEDYVGMPTECGAGACLATGMLSCVGGQVVDSCASGSAGGSDLVCDGLDSNCDGQTDEGYVPYSTTCGVGVCQATGVTSCLLGVEQNSCVPGTPTGSDANCDGQDDNCDGQTDEGYVPVATQCGVGACSATGSRSCEAGLEVDSCAPLMPATADTTCNGVDDDCDGQADEDYVATPTSCGVGACQRSGSIECQSGALTTVCTAGSAAADDSSCNGIDDDCDGQVDEDYLTQPTSCGVGACLRSGTVECQNGAPLTVCTAGTGSTSDDLCNGIDDDCDGSIDEDFVVQSTTCGTGACQANGTTSCVAGLVTNSCTEGTGSPTDNSCNGIDDDCDGSVDEDYVAEPTSCGVGVCAATGTTSCVAGSPQDSCQPGPAGGTDDNCDGLDDDCDGTADDEYLPRTVSCGVGVCAATGSTVCIAGGEQQECQAGTPALSDDSCNGLDDDCDGTIDEEYVSAVSNCGVGACARTGMVDCVAGAPVDSCTAGPPAPDDASCDGIDNDCNGTADEDYVPVASSCGIGSCVSEGQRNCIAGEVVDNCQARPAAADDSTCNGQDDDCNGQIDEDFVGQQTSCGIGACVAQGTQSCNAGSISDNCSPALPAAADADCDGVDNDCDGSIDEEYVSQPVSCGVGACVAMGATACSAGQIVQNCQAGSPSGADDDCDGVDDDCDGAADEAFGVRCSGTAREICVSGAISHHECLDSNPCNGTESCNAGVCQSGTAPVLSDGNPCTADTCDPIQGIQHTPANAGTSCGTQQACDGQGNCIAQPQITQQPQSISVAPGQTAVFSVAASGDSLTYQWRRLGQNIPGATGNSYSRANVTLADQAAEFTVIVSNSAGAVTSATAILSVADTAGPLLSISGGAERTVATDIVTLTGTALDSGVAASAVVVQSNRWQGEVAAIVSGGTGAFSVEVPLSTGLNQLTVIARDAQNNTTQQAVAVTLCVSSLPLLAITSPSSGTRIAEDSVDVRGTVRSSLAPTKIRLTLGTDVQFPEGSDGEYTFLFPAVRLVNGTNALTVRAETSEGAVTTQVVVTRGDAANDTGAPPAIRVMGAQSDLFVTSNPLTVNGTVTAERCVSGITVNGVAASTTGAGSQISFEGTLMLPLGGVVLPIVVTAEDCDGRSATLSYNVSFDDQAPILNVAQAPAPTVHTVTSTPFLLAGTITEPNLAGFTVGQQSIGLLPGDNGTWDFATSIPLTRAVDTPIELVAWDRAGNRTTQSLLVRLDVPFEIEVISPKAEAVLNSVGAQVALPIVARVVGLAADQGVTAQVDTDAFYQLNRAGDTYTNSLAISAVTGGHQVQVAVRDASGGVLLSKVIPFSVRAAEDIPLEATLQEPLNESQNLEANQPISIVFNRPIDPTRFTLELRETLQGKQYKKLATGSGLGQFNDTELEDVVRDNELVPGGLSFLPGDQYVAFYPAREFGYGARVVLTGRYDGQEVVRGTFGIRPMPTLLAGFVADQFANPIPGIKVKISGPVSRETQTADNGTFSFGYGDYAATIPAGRYQLVVNPDLANRYYGIMMRTIDAQAGRYNELGILRTTILDASEPFRSVASGSSVVRLYGGALELDLSQASLEFPGGQLVGDVHTQIQWGAYVGYPGLDLTSPLFAYAMQPMGIGVVGLVGANFEMPAPYNTDKVFDGFGDWVLVSALDPASMRLLPVGVAKIDRATRRARTERPLYLKRLDFIGITPMPSTSAQQLLSRYASGEIDLNQLTMSLSALR